ncbi:MAG: nucleoid occlusion factor SlmA [Pseudomonadales bacterium]|nr:nucleoid occlusion factor SlmA [Pseudomonadales bacterium]MDG1442544.1 nucleoid occlusion factor SlmA [Pseudomonadales bacterium]
MSESSKPDKVSRKQQILQALAEMLELTPGGRITTAGLAKQVGVSEAALYRHFPSKAKMFEGLIEFIEDTIFSRVNSILNSDANTQHRCHNTLYLLLSFTEKNPGITRILTGDPLSGESDRLRIRVAQFFDRLETQLRQMLRESELRDGRAIDFDIPATANLMLSTVEGRISQFVRSNFEQKPTQDWELQWQIISMTIFPARRAEGE